MPQQFASPTLSPFTAADGENLALHEWPVAADTPLRGLVVLVHGLGEHAGRYGAVAEQLNTWGFAVRGYDHYGHGESAGPRGGLSSDTRLLDDLADMIECTRARLPPGLPLVLLGHSMGGLVAARLVSLNLCPVDALVLSSPALDARWTSTSVDQVVPSANRTCSIRPDVRAFSITMRSDVPATNRVKD